MIKMYIGLHVKSPLFLSDFDKTCILPIEEKTNQQNAQINFGLINLLLFNHSNMFRPLNRSHHQGVQNP